jgi:hypothetical protein
LSADAATPDGTQRVFISYRREETAAYAGRIYDAMVARFGESNVFMDVELAPGVDFVDRITEVVSGCAALIVVIGPTWPTISGSDGQPRLYDSDDFVRQEVATAIKRSDVTVIPALVNKAQMPRPEQLPEDLHPLTRRNALELSDGRWRYDVGRLTDSVDELLGGVTASATQTGADRPLPPVDPGPTPARLLVEGILVAAVAGFFARYASDWIPESKETAAKIAGIVGRRTETWALIGAVLALWLGLRAKRTDFARLGLFGLLLGALAGAVGGALYAFPVTLHQPDLTIEQSQGWEAISLAATGALIGGLVGSLWRQPRFFAGCASGLFAGALVQLFLNAANFDGRDFPQINFAFAIRAAAIAGVTLAVMIALDYLRETSTPPSRAGAT